MICSSRIASAALGLVLLVGSGAAQQSIVGTWKGKIIVNTEKIRNAKDPKMASLLRAQLATVAKFKISLSLSPNHTFVMKVSGSPIEGQNRTRIGTWTLKGDKLTLLDAVNAVHPNPFTVAKDGKSFMLTLPNGIESLKYIR